MKKFHPGNTPVFLRFTIVTFWAILLSFFCFSQEMSKLISPAHDGEVISVSINSEGTSIVSGGTDKKTYLWDAKTGNKLKALSLAGIPNSVVFNSSGKLFVIACNDMKLYVIDGKEGKPKRLLKEKDQSSEATAAAFNPVNDNLASGYKDNSVKIWDETNNISITTFRDHQSVVNALSFSPDGKNLASGSADDKIIIYDLAENGPKATMNSGSKGVLALAYSPDGKLLASGGAANSVKLWDAGDGKMISEFNECRSSVNAIVFSADAQYLFAGSGDGKIYIFSLETKQLVKSFAAHSNGTNSLSYCDKGNVLVSGGKDGTIKLWDLSSLKIGKKKFVASSGEPKIVCSNLSLKEDNNNGIMDAGEKPSIEFTVRNQGKGQAYNLMAKVSMDSHIEGISYEKETVIGNLDVDKTQTVSIPIIINENLETNSGAFIITLDEANGFNPSPVKLNFQTGGSSGHYFVMITGHEYSSPTGKAELGAPISLKLKIKNVTEGEAKNIKVNFLMPEKVMANKLSETISSMAAGEEKEINMQFHAMKEFTGTSVKIGLSVEGVAFSNAADIICGVKLNEPLPGAQVFKVEAPAVETASEGIGAPLQAEGQPLYRGGGDPLKGLNVAKAKDMVIGSYYALVIGVDKYKGAWPALLNAVNDAKAIEGMLKSKYKFEVVHSMYNEQATREKIINEFEWLVSNVKPQDNVFIYYSGHGEYKQELNKGFWVPVDAETQSTSKYISNSDIQTFLGGIKSKHTLLVSDACFSGDIFRGNTVSVPFEESEKYYKEVHGLVSRQALTSGGIEPVMDGGKEGHSVFAYYFLKTLGDNASKYIDASQLYNKIKIPVINNSEQTPKFNPIKNTGDEGGQFIFIKK